MCRDSRRCCAGWIAQPRAEDSDKVRCSVMHGAFRRVLRRAGYFNVKSTLDVCVKVNAVQVPKGFYDETDGWHITSGDSDQDHYMRPQRQGSADITAAMKAKDAGAPVGAAHAEGRDHEQGRREGTRPRRRRGAAGGVVAREAAARLDRAVHARPAAPIWWRRKPARSRCSRPTSRRRPRAAEIDAAVAAAIAETGATSPKDMGKVMKAVMPMLAGKNADGKAVNEAVRRKLGA